MMENAPSLVQRTLVGIATLTSPLEVGAGDSPQVLDRLEGTLRETGVPTLRLGTLGTASGDGGSSASPGSAARAVGEAGRKAAAAGVTSYLFVPVSWFEDYLVTDLLEEWRAPIFLWPRPGMETGALCGAQQLGWMLHELGYDFDYAFGPLDSTACRHRADTFARAAALRAALRRARVGIAGQRVDGMTHTAPNEAALKRIVGPRVVPIEAQVLTERAAAIVEDRPDDVDREWKSVSEAAGRVNVAAEAGHEAMAFYLALAESIDTLALDAVTVGCYPSLMGRPCLAASLLADRGIPLACEGDVNGAVGMLILSLLSGSPVHSTDWLDPLPDGAVVFTHCGSGSFSLAESPGAVTLDSVRLMGEGVCALFPAKPGPVTLLSLNARSGGYQIACLEGVAEPTGMVFPGNPVKVRFAVDTGEIIDWIFREGIGHHWSIGYGHYGEVIEKWASMLPPGAAFLSGPTLEGRSRRST